MSIEQAAANANPLEWINGEDFNELDGWQATLHCDDKAVIEAGGFLESGVVIGEEWVIIFSARYSQRMQNDAER